jgi:Photosynthetic reaction centre cytochrome C subunit
MLINRKIFIALGLCSVVSLVALTSMAPDDDAPKNLKVLPKSLTERQVHQVMHEWSVSLGVHCDFCHAANADGKGLDFAADTKPEKEMARHMYKMMDKINDKYFEAKKDSLGMVMHSGINCYTCHRGDSHPEVKVPEGKRGPGGPPPGGGPGGPPPGGPGGPPPGGGTGGPQK